MKDDSIIGDAIRADKRPHVKMVELLRRMATGDIESIERYILDQLRQGFYVADEQFQMLSAARLKLRLIDDLAAKLDRSDG